MNNLISKIAVGVLVTLAALGSFAQEDVIRKTLSERLPKMPKIEAVSKSPVAGLYEIKVGASEIYYTDAGGNFLIEGQIIDTKSGKNLTEERLNQLTAIRFDELPLKDAIVIKRGTGARKLAVFEDPNCGYCKRFEADLEKINHVTIYLFLYPILGADSTEKSKAIWCSADKVRAWQDWMLMQVPPKSSGKCNADAISRNVAFGQKHRITGTPSIFLADGMRIPGAITAAQLEQLLVQTKAR